MSGLEDFVKAERDRFDQVQPPEHHDARFLRKLDAARTRQSRTQFTFWRVAAAGALLMLAGASLLLPRFRRPADEQYGSLCLGDVSKELADVELYYTLQLERGYKELATIADSDAEVQSILIELDNLNKTYKQLEKELYVSGNHELVITAMIENFRLRLSLIESLEEKMKTQHDPSKP
jgi:hypothetical protein